MQQPIDELLGQKRKIIINPAKNPVTYQGDLPGRYVSAIVSQTL